jgi:hypothetical protein
MIMVRYEAIGRNMKVKDFGSLLEYMKKCLKVFSIQKNILSSPATVHHMVPGAGILYSKGPCHKFSILQQHPRVKQRLDPFSSLLPSQLRLVSSWFPDKVLNL